MQFSRVDALVLYLIVFVLGLGLWTLNLILRENHSEGSGSIFLVALLVKLAHEIR